MSFRVCPVCANRHAQLVAEDCAVCNGTGLLRLGAAALSLYDPPVVSMAAVIALEAVARETDLTLTLSDDRTKPIRSAINDLITAGVLSSGPRPARKPTTLPRRRDKTGRFAFELEPTALASECVQQTIIPLDEVLVTAGRYVYTEDDRPNARGLPLLSANGHPSHLARLTDPEPAGNDTRMTVRDRNREKQHATALTEAVPETIAKKQRKRKRATQ